MIGDLRVFLCRVLEGVFCEIHVEEPYFSLLKGVVFVSLICGFSIFFSFHFFNILSAVYVVQDIFFVTWGCVCRWEQNSRRKVCYWWLHNVDGLPYASSTSSWIFASLWLCNLWRTLCKKVDECLYFLIYFCSLYSVCFAIELGWEMWYS